MPSRPIKKKLAIQLILPMTYNEFTVALHRLGSNGGAQLDFLYIPSSTSLYRNHCPSTHGPSNGDAMDLSRARVKAVTTDYEEYDEPLNNQVERISAISVAPSSAPTRQQRREWQDAGLCRCCGSGYHWSSDCPGSTPASSVRDPGEAYLASWQKNYDAGYD